VVIHIGDDRFVMVVIPCRGRSCEESEFDADQAQPKLPRKASFDSRHGDHTSRKQCHPGNQMGDLINTNTRGEVIKTSQQGDQQNPGDRPFLRPANQLSC
jgi:hypothetical protein